MDTFLYLTTLSNIKEMNHNTENYHLVKKSFRMENQRFIN